MDDLERWRRMKRERPSRIERPGAGQESVWDYPRPPRVEAVADRLRVEFAGVTVADTQRGLRVLETASPPTYYFPEDDVRTEYLVLSPKHSVCEWKGAARYWTVRVGDREADAAAWGYPDPFDGYEQLRNHFAFFAGKMDACYVGDERVTPQPGDFYGGWVTSAIVGPFKGDPGTEMW